MRRAPPAGTPPLAARAAAAAARMAPAAARARGALRAALEAGGVAALGRLARCGKKAKDFAGETWRRHVESEVTDARARALKEAQRRLEADSVFAWLGTVRRSCCSSTHTLGLRGFAGMLVTAGLLGCWERWWWDQTLLPSFFHNFPGTTLPTSPSPQILQEELEAAEAADAAGAAAGPLRDHRPLTCNADDYLRMVAVPRRRGANFRGIAGVVTHPDGTCCTGAWHAPSQVERAGRLAPGLCPGGGCAVRPGAGGAGDDDDGAGDDEAGADPAALDGDASASDGDDEDEDDSGSGGGGRKRARAGSKSSGGAKSSGGGSKKGGGSAKAKQQQQQQAPPGPKTQHRVDNYASLESGAWRGTRLAGCDARTAFLPTGDLACPRWCVTYKRGKSNGRHGCFGRIWYDGVQTTVVTRAEPHNLQLLHPQQDRVLTVRENARCQVRAGGLGGWAGVQRRAECMRWRGRGRGSAAQRGHCVHDMRALRVSCWPRRLFEEPEGATTH